MAVFAQKKKAILVVCHDAGGAEIISSYVRKFREKYSFICFVSGPAVKIFARKKIRAEYFKDDIQSVKKAISYHKDLFMVMAGTTGSLPNFELKSIKIAKAKGIKTVSYLDHWVGYKERFGFPQNNWQDNLPDEIWAGDEYAYKLAVKLLPAKIKLVPNPYFEEMVKECNRMAKKEIPPTILFMSEPVNEYNISRKERLNHHYFSTTTEEDVLDKLLSYLVGSRTIFERIIVRLHPSEKKTKYDKLLSKYDKLLKGIKIINSNSNLLEDISRSTLVIGMESTALVVAHLCGKKVVSVLPKRKNKFTLPFKIIKLDKIEDLKNLLQKSDLS